MRSRSKNLKNDEIKQEVSSEVEDEAEIYMRNCSHFNIPVDPNVVIALKTK